MWGSCNPGTRESEHKDPACLGSAWSGSWVSGLQGDLFWKTNNNNKKKTITTRKGRSWTLAPHRLLSRWGKNLKYSTFHVNSVNTHTFLPHSSYFPPECRSLTETGSITIMFQNSRTHYQNNPISLFSLCKMVAIGSIKIPNNVT